MHSAKALRSYDVIKMADLKICDFSCKIGEISQFRHKSYEYWNFTRCFAYAEGKCSVSFSFIVRRYFLKTEKGCIYRPHPLTLTAYSTRKGVPPFFSSKWPQRKRLLTFPRSFSLDRVKTVWELQPPPGLDEGYESKILYFRDHFQCSLCVHVRPKKFQYQ